MARLMRLHFASVGVPAARFAPLTLDFRSPGGEGRFGDDTVLWLRNGGGKSSILNLLFSVIIPSRRDFLGETADGRNQRFASYVKERDLSFVIAEWYMGPTGQQDLVSDDTQRRTWVTGQMLHWAASGSTQDDANLRRWFFAFRTGVGMELESLPVHGLAAPCATNARGFREWFDGQRRAFPGAECYGTENQADWQSALRETLRLDPDVFRLQLEMNRQEGGADRVMRFKTASEFAQFAFREASDPRPAQELVRRLEQLRARQSQRPARVLEQRFLLAVQQPLREVEEQARAVSGADARLAAEHAGRVALATAIGDRTQELLREQQSTRQAADIAAARAKDLDRQAAERDATALWHQRESLRLESARAEESLREAREALAQAKADLQATVAARSWLRLRDVRSALDALREARAQSQREREPQLQELRRAAAVYRAALEIARAQNSERAGETRALLAANGEAIVRAMQQQTQARDEAERVQLGIGDHAGRIRQRDSAWEALGREGIVREGESPEEARHRHDAALETLRRDADAHAARIRDDEAAQQEHAARRAELEKEQATLAALLQRDRKDLSEAFGVRDALAAHPAWREIDADPTDLFAEAPVHALRVARDAAQARMTGLEIEGHEDRRLAEHAKRTGLLPPTRDAEAAHQWLTRHGVTAHHAGEYLAGQRLAREEVAALFAGDPARFSGIVVLTAQQLDRARALPPLQGLTGPVVVALPAVDAAPADDGRIVLPSSAPGTASAPDAAEALARAEERLEELDAKKREIAARASALTALMQRLEAFREAWGAGRLDELAHRADARQREAEATASTIADAAALLGDIAARLVAARLASKDLEKQAAEQSKRRERLAAFLRDHEEGIESRRRLLAELQQRRADLAAEADATARALERLRADGEQQRNALRETEREGATLAGEIDAIPSAYLVGDTADARPLDVAGGAYRQLRRLYEENPAIERLNGEIAQLEKQEQSADAEFRKESGSVEEARWRRFADDPMPEIAMAGVDTAHREAVARDATTAAERDRAAKALAAFQREHPHVPEPPSARPLHTPEEHDRARRACLAEAEAHRRDAAASRHERTEAERLARDLGSDAKRLETMAKRLATNQPPLAGEPLPALELPRAVEAVEALVDAAATAFEEATRRLDRARKVLADRVAAARRAAEAPEFAELRDSLRSWIRAGEGELVAETPRRNLDIHSRLAALHEELQTMETDRGLVLGELVRLAIDSRRLLASIQKTSTIPPGLQDWSGQQFVEVRLPSSGTSPEESQERLRPLLEELTSEERLPLPEVLCVRAVEALSGGRRLDIQIIKPHALGAVHRCPIGDLGSFSDGERLTASVLLYCTLAKLRARQRGQQDDHSGGVLILDNPIGKCSNQALLALQKKVARSLGVQLVYTTGIEDLGAIATFARVIRLANSSRSRETGDLHVRVDSHVSAAGLSFTAGPEAP